VDVATSLGLVYGAFFGFRVLHDPDRYTRFGQIKDDVERTLRYWHKDGIILRFQRYAVWKAQKPGKFHASKGGISAGSSEEVHRRRGQLALHAILEDFASSHARLPKAGERCGDCGLVWNGERKLVAAPKKKAQKLYGKRMFSNEVWASVSNELFEQAGKTPGMCEVISEISTRWQALSPEEQSRYDALAKEANAAAEASGVGEVTGKPAAPKKIKGQKAREKNPKGKCKGKMRGGAGVDYCQPLEATDDDIAKMRAAGA